MKSEDLGLNSGTKEKSFYIIMTYQNTNNVDCLYATQACYIFTNFSASNIQNMEIYKVNLYPYIHVHV